MATKTKWSPPEGWAVERQENVLHRGTGERTDMLIGTRTYQDGTERTFVAHSEDEFDRLVQANDDDVERKARIHG